MLLESILRSWRRDPALPKRAYRGVGAWQDGSPENDLPLTQEEVESAKCRLREIAPSHYANLFPNEPIVEKTREQGSPEGSGGDKPLAGDSPSEVELKLTAAMYASRPGVLDHVQRTGRLPKEISMGGASIQARHLIAARGVDIVMTEAERIVYDAIIREGHLPGGRLILVPECGSDGQGFRSGESDEQKVSEDQPADSSVERRPLSDCSKVQPQVTPQDGPLMW